MPAQLIRAVGTEAIGGHHRREPPLAGACNPQDRCNTNGVRYLSIPLDVNRSWDLRAERATRAQYGLMQ